MEPPKTLRELLDFDPATKKVKTRESKHREFKETFDEKAFSAYTKVLAAFSNTDGGILIFGVADKPRCIVGVDPTLIPDEAKWVDRLHKDFDPEISIEIKEYEQDGLSIVAIAVKRSEHRPVICKRSVSEKVTDKKGKEKDVPVLHESMIYYRYTGKTAPIRYSELSDILAERDERKLRSMLENLEIMGRIGAEKVGIVDVSKAGVPGTGTTLYVSKETAKSLTFIDRAKLVEDEGAPAYVVAGTVELNQVVERLIPDEDKILPERAAALILPTLKEAFDDDIGFTAMHLAKLATALGIRDVGNPNEDYFLFDKSFKRPCYRTAAIDLIKAKIAEDPLATLKAFGSKATLAKYLPANDGAE